MTALSADRPGSNPQDNLFGCEPFSESLVNRVFCYPGNNGVIFAVYGHWGLGKFTV